MGRETIYGPGPIRSRKAVCPDCKREHTYYGQSRGGRKRCGSCQGRISTRYIWIAVWKKHGKLLEELSDRV